MKRVLLLCPGDLELGGGRGRQIGYFLSALPQDRDTPTNRVVDTRGPWFLARARWGIPLSAAYLVVAALRIARVGMVDRPALIHANIPGRGSTLRKLVLIAAARAVTLSYALHIHDYDYAADVSACGRMMGRLVRGTFATAEQTIVLGTAAERPLRAALRLADSSVLVLPNAVPDPHPSPVRGFGAAAAGPVGLVFLGYLSDPVFGRPRWARAGAVSEAKLGLCASCGEDRHRKGPAG